MSMDTLFRYYMDFAAYFVPLLIMAVWFLWGEFRNMERWAKHFFRMWEDAEERLYRERNAQPLESFQEWPQP
jgi:hypothetical protein